MPQKTKKEYFNENIKLNTEGFSYRTFCKRTENISYEKWNLVFNTPNYNEYKKSLISDDVYEIRKNKKEVEVKASIKKDTPRKRNLVPKKGDDVYQYYMSHPNPGVVYRTFRDKVNSGMALDQAILKKSQLSKIKRDESDVISMPKNKFNRNNPLDVIEVGTKIAKRKKKIDMTEIETDNIEYSSMDNLIDEIPQNERNDKIDLLKEYKEQRKNLCYVFSKINKTRHTGTINGIYIITEEISEGLLEVMDIKGNTLKIVESKFIKALK